MLIYDAHIHNVNKEKGGFLIGLEGQPKFEGTLTNKEALKLHDIEKKIISFYYVSKDEINQPIGWQYLKYHPRRERYTPKQVTDSIRQNYAKAIIIDTLNEPYWVAYDYWNIAREFPAIVFIFAHSGGYLINDFIKICHFQPNVWIDFSATQNILGVIGKEKECLPYIKQAMEYALNSPFKNRILLSSDHPFFDQEEIFKFYEPYLGRLNDNFDNILNLIK